MSLITDNPDILELQSRLEDADAVVRRIALIALADLEDPDSLPWLTEALRQDPASNVRAESARLLEAWEDAPVVTALCQALTDADQEVREAAAQSLSQLKTEAAGQLLLPWARHADPFVRGSALRALRELRLPASAQVAREALNDPAAAIRREAVGILGWLKHTEALADLTQRLATDDDIEVRRMAAGAVGFAGTPAVIEALTTALNDPQWQVREEAATTLGKVGDESAGSALLLALDDAYWQVRLRAVRSLGRLKYSPARGAVESLLSHSISNLRKESALALGEFGDPQALPALRLAEHDGDPEVRKAVRIALSQLEP
ncbi:HEAT repeat domain-containing protein [Pseudomonas cichorii]|uniref:HEAT repeat domain-containing protein n=1 Tax=Pseudomonas cichorii TaxID=36746 RepID=UPI001C8A5D56|nr:HEAT repeat domain-containing protein [Pseudomonas cichorii]MBX8574010.1 HEAT repeat domain-containing protein [Pseudomonas cichorii]